MAVILPTDEEAETAALDLEALSPLAREWMNRGSAGAGHLSEEDELEARFQLWRWVTGRSRFLCLAESWLGRALETPESFLARCLGLKMGFKSRREPFLASLESMGFSRVDQVESPGEYAVRGEVIDLWPSGEGGPLRLLWNLDVIDAIRRLNLATQRSEGFVDETALVPLGEGGAPGGGGKTFAEGYLVRAGAVVQKGEPSPALSSLSGPHLLSGAAGTAEEGPGFAPSPVVPGRVEALKTELLRLRGESWRTAIFCHNRGEADRLEEILNLKPPPSFLLGPLLKGFLDPGKRLAVFTNAEIFGRARHRPRWPKFEGSALRSFTELKEGDTVVHERYGIGRYRGLERIRTRGLESEFLRIDYKGGDRLFVPVFDLKQVQKYVGAEGRRPVLSRMDTASWERVKARAREEVARLAKELLERAAERALRPGHAFAPDSHMERELADAFLYDLTPDQARAVQEVREDMISPRPMDRVVCGDVGYGKTEVAMRAAFKAVVGRKQVAVLAPTTILAEQHLRTFRERFADYPVSIALVSRFQPRAEEEKVLKDVRRGVIDILIGTQRLLQPDIAFKDLGLVIVDEEHRFGVKDKERLLGYRGTLDVLALTATPIPRTLASALGGLKGLSMIQSPPEGRQAIATHVGVFEESLVREAVQSELARGGQIYYVHNRIRTLSERRAWLEGLLPGVSIGTAHGRMKGPALEKTMWEFLHGRFRILLSTTIIESGLDIPTVNTLIVEDAEEFGLAQLYQLRGRVGRSRTKAYCFLFYSPGRLTSEARQRLEALREFGALGSGFHLAVRDLEIRGAGNLLGPEQHGTLSAVGLDTYSQLLAEEIDRQKGRVHEAPAAGPVFEIAASAFLPADYLPSESERIHTYKRILGARREDLETLKEELTDRCGPPPDPVRNLFLLAELRALAEELGVAKVAQAREGLELFFAPERVPRPEALQRLLEGDLGPVRFLPGPPQGIRFEKPAPEECLEFLSGLLTGWLAQGLTKAPPRSIK